MRSRHFRLTAGLFAVGILVCAGFAFGGEPRTASAPVKAAWSAIPLRDVAGQLARLSGMPVIIDRRVDPTTPISFEADGESADAVIAGVAAEAGAESARLRSLVRIGPGSHLDRCVAGEKARIREIARLPAPDRKLLDAAAAWAWPAGSRPRDLVEAAAVESGVTIDGLDGIPHDHFQAFEGASMPLADRLDMVLAHFDLRVAWARDPGGKKPHGRIVPLPDATEPRAAGDTPSRSALPSRGRQVYTLQLAAPLDEALAAVTKQLGLSLAIDSASLEAQGISPREIVRVNVRSATRDELVAALVTPLSLSWRIEQDTLQVWADAP